MKSQIPKEKKAEIEGAILQTVRIWLVFAIVLYVPVQIFNIFRKEDLVPMTDQIIHWVLILLVFVTVVWSCLGNKNSLRLGMVVLQLRIYYAVFQRKAIINTSVDTSQILMYSVCIMQVCYTNQVIICQLFQNHYHKLNFSMLFVLYLGFFNRMIGLEVIASKVNLIVVMTIIGLVLGLIVQQRIGSIRMSEFREINQMIYNLKLAQARDKELIFDSLDQGIMLVKDAKVIFQNEICADIFQQIAGGLEAIGNGDTLIQQKLFNLFDQSRESINQVFSLQDLINLPTQQLNSMLFQLAPVSERSDPENSFFNFI